MKKVISIILFSLISSSFICLHPQWVQTRGPEHGFICALAVNGENLFAGTWRHGVFLSTNNGKRWTAVNSGLTDTSVLALAVSGTNLFAGTWDGGIFLSPNSGTSWAKVLSLRGGVCN